VLDRLMLCGIVQLDQNDGLGARNLVPGLVLW